MVTLKNWGTALGTRERGTQAREALEAALAGQPTQAITVDLVGVERVSPSFADECFGKLAASLGVGEVSKRLRFANAEQSVARVIIYAITNRLAPDGTGQAPSRSSDPPG